MIIKLQDVSRAIDNIKDKNSDTYLNLNIGLFDSYIKQEQYDSAYKLIESINILNIYKTANFDESNILKWASIIEILDRKMKIYKIVNNIEKLKNLVIEGKTIMKRAEKYFSKYNPETRRDIDSVPVLAVIVVMIVGVVAFIMLVIIFCKNNPIDIHGVASERTYKAYKLITKEGYVTLGICIFIFPNVTRFI